MTCNRNIDEDRLVRHVKRSPDHESSRACVRVVVLQLPSRPRTRTGRILRGRRVRFLGSDPRPRIESERCGGTKDVASLPNNNQMECIIMTSRQYSFSRITFLLIFRECFPGWFVGYTENHVFVDSSLWNCYVLLRLIKLIRLWFVHALSGIVCNIFLKCLTY